MNRRHMHCDAQQIIGTCKSDLLPKVKSASSLPILHAQVTARCAGDRGAKHYCEAEAQRPRYLKAAWVSNNAQPRLAKRILLDGTATEICLSHVAFVPGVSPGSNARNDV